jgi:hypothetical protein
VCSLSLAEGSATQTVAGGGGNAACQTDNKLIVCGQQNCQISLCSERITQACTTADGTQRNAGDIISCLAVADATGQSFSCPTVDNCVQSGAAQRITVTTVNQN